MNCHDYELQIGDAVDGTLDASSQGALDAHLATCERCRQLAEDFRAIRAASLQLGPEAPPPHLWTRIAAAIDAQQRPAPSRVEGPRWFGMRIPAWPSFAAAAAAVALVAAVSWMAWRDLSPVANPDPPIVAADMADPDPQPVEVELKLAEDQYVAAITGLEEIAKTGGGELDPQTADVLQASLTVIDQAIGESRAALEAEPASDLAQESLFDALRNKVALLQDAVALINEMRKGNEEGAARIVSGLNQ